MNPYHNFFYPLSRNLGMVVLLLIQVTFSAQKVNGQALGGIPDPAFNPKDTGRFQLLSFNSITPNHVFEGPGKTTFFVEYSANAYLKMFPYAGYGATSDSNVLIPSFPTQTCYFFKKPNAFYSSSINLVYTNGKPIINFILNNSGTSFQWSPVPAGPFFRKDWKLGLEMFSSSIFYIYPEGDSLGETPRKIWISKLKEYNMNVLKTDSIHGFDFQKSSTDGSRLYLFGNQTLPNSSKKFSIKVIDTNLITLPNEFPLLPADFSFNDLHFIKRLSNGQWLLGGSYQLNGVQSQGVIRLNPNGSIDTNFAGISFPSNTSFKMGEDGSNLIIGYFNGSETDARIIVGTYTQNGAFISSRTTESFSGKVPLTVAMYQSELKQFIVSTEPINFDYYKKTWHFGSSKEDSVWESRFTFWVDLNGKIIIPEKHNGLMLMNSHVPPNNEYGLPSARSLLNPFIKKLTICGNYGMYQGKYYPSLFVIDSKGNLDTTFKGLHHFPKKFRQEYGAYGFLYRFMPLQDNSILTYAAAYPYLPYLSDSVRKWNYDGTENINFQKYRAYNKLLPTRDSCFLSIIATNNGFPIKPDFDTKSGSLIEVVKINKFGEKIGILSSFISSSDTFSSVNSRRIHIPQVVDNKDNLWITSIVPGRKFSIIRIGKNGSVRRYQSDSLTYVLRIISVSTSNQGDISMVGNFEVFRDTVNYVNGTFNFLRFDSNFVLKEKIQFVLPDAFGSRDNGDFYGLTKLPDGKFLFHYNWVTGIGTPNEQQSTYMLRYTQNGKFDPTFMPIHIPDFYGLFYNVLDDRLIIGSTGSNERPGSSPKNGLHSFILNSLSSEFGYAQGRIKRLPSPASGCNPVGDRQDVANRVVQNAGTNQITLSDKNGFYSMPLTPGSHQLSQVILRDALERQICPPLASPNIPVTISGPGDVALNNQFLNQTYNCSRLSMSVLQPRFRLCSRGRFTIQYRNDGMGAEPNARIRITLPKLVKIESASRAFSIQTDSSYVFDLGNLAPGQGGTIAVSDTIGCVSTPDSSARACFSVRMEPLSICAEVNPAVINWSGAWLDAKAQYQPVTDKVRYVIYNRGANMTDSTYLNLFPVDLSVPKKLKLQAGDSLVFLLPVLDMRGQRLLLQQPANCPIGSFGNLAHVGRNTAVFYLSFADGWFSQQTATACPEFRYSYDPNEKLVEPVDPVEPGTELNYTIHFENYGNDTAYAVIIADTLPTGLDITTFRMTGSSHDCEPRLAGTVDNPVVFFNFLPIRLPGKKQDSVLSKGQVDFKIRLKPTVALGSIHQNKAHIYFDRNEPIITNTTITKVRNPDEPTEVSGRLLTENRMVLFPNPSRNAVSIGLPTGFEKTELRITDIQGKVCLRKRISRTSSVDVSGLQSGVYLILVDGLKTERLIVIH